MQTKEIISIKDMAELEACIHKARRRVIEAPKILKPIRLEKLYKLIDMKKAAKKAGSYTAQEGRVRSA